MSVRCVVLASVSSAFLAACVAVSGPAFAASKDPNVLIAEQAYQALAAGDQFSAIIAYTQAIESQKLPVEALANALVNRALAHQQRAEHEDAINDYTSALQLDAMSAKLRANALYNRGLSHQKLNQSSAAIEDFTGALFLDPTFALSYYSRGNVLRESGQLLFALSDYEKARRYKHIDAARVYYAEALAYESLKRPDDAWKSLELAVIANPKFRPATQKLAMLSERAPTEVAASQVAMSVGGGITLRKPDLPKAVEPEEILLNAGSDPILTASITSAKIVDRIPVEEKTAAADPVPAADEERIVAVEAVDEEPVAEVGPAMDVADASWSVQVASAASEDSAWSTWKKMQAKHRALAGQKPVVIRADLGKKGVVYRVRLGGFEDQSSAKSTCVKLKAKGVSCFVSRLNS
jgi:tetratricopeptide (TPR) repeat protein